MVARLQWLASLVRRRRGFEQDLVDELSFHIDARTDTLIARGLSPDAARRQARLEFGSVQNFRERSREAGGFRWLDDARMDLRHSLRGFRRTPGFAVAVVAILALGIGATTAVFTVADEVLFRPPPYLYGDRLTQVVGLDKPHGSGGNTFNAHRVHGWQQQNLFERVEAMAPRQFEIGGDGEPQRLSGTLATPGYFALLGVAPALGRTFAEGDGRPDSEPVVVLSDEVWRRQFGGAPEAIERTLVLNDEPYRVIGVMPSRFRESKLWIPYDAASHDGDAAPTNFILHGRLKPGVTIEAVQQRADTLASALNESDPQPRWYLGIRQWRVVYASVEAKTILLLLLGTGGFVLLVGSANVANLLLARATVHERESIVRAALGASRGRLVRMALAEGALISLMAGGVGIGLAWLGVRAIVVLMPQAPGFLDFSTIDVAIDWRILGFAAAVTMATALLISVFPAVRRSGVRLATSGTASGVVRSSRRLPGVLIVAEVALSMVLLVGAALLMKTLIVMTALEPGFAPRGLVALEVSIPSDRYPTTDVRREFFDAVLNRIVALAGVRGATTSAGLPPSTVGFSIGVVEGDDRPAAPDEKEVEAANLYVSAGYFRTMQIALITGRDFRSEEADNVIINTALAEHLWPNGTALGHRIRLWKEAPWQTVVGVVGDVDHRIGAERLAWTVYFPLNGAPGQTRATMPPRRGVSRSFIQRWVIVRAEDPMALVPVIQQQIRAIDARVPIERIEDLEQRWREVRAPQRFALLLVACLAAIAVTLAGVGLLAMIAHDIAQRTHEIGIRMALGAPRGNVLKLVLGATTLMTVAGIALGLAGAAALTKYMEGVLFGVSPLDPRMFALAVVVFAVVAGVASYLPSRRAIRLNPQSALRWE